MDTLWCWNAKTDEIFDYHVYDAGENGYERDDTDFPKGDFLVYGDYLVTGFDSQEEAREWAGEWSPCPKCETIRKGKSGETCIACGSELVTPEGRKKTI